MTLKVLGLQNGPYQENSSYEEQINQLSAHFEQVLADSPEVDLVIFPELMTSPYFCMFQDDLFFSLAEPLKGKTYQHFSQKAQNHQVNIVVTIFEKEEYNGETHFYNTALLISDSGELIGHYRKTHIPTLVLPTLSTNEAYYFERGTEFPVFELKGYKIGLLICFDRSFPEAARTLAEQGAELIIIPTAASGEDRKSTWLAECASRAMENGVYVMGVNRAGEESLNLHARSDLSFFGLSCLYGPSGQEIFTLDSTPWTHLSVTIEKEAIRQTRSKLNFLNFIQSDLYKTNSNELQAVRKFKLEQEIPPLFRPEGAVSSE